MLDNRVYWATVDTLDWGVLIAARSERIARGLALKYFLASTACSEWLSEEVVCGLVCRLERYENGKPVKTSQPVGVYESVPEWHELGFDGDEFDHWLIEEHEAHVRLFDELAADENPELTLNNPLICDKEAD